MAMLRSLHLPLTLCLAACAGEAFESASSNAGGASGQGGAVAGASSQGGQGGTSAGGGAGGAGAAGQGGDGGAAGSAPQAGAAGAAQAGAGQGGSAGAAAAGQGGSAGAGQGGGAGSGGDGGSQAGSAQAGSAQGGEGQAGQSLGGSGQGGSAAGGGGSAGAPACGPDLPCQSGVCVEGVCRPCGSSLDCVVGQACVAGSCVDACSKTQWLDVSGHGHHGKLVGVGGWEGDGSLGSPFALRLTPKGEKKGGVVLPGDATPLLFSKKLTVEVWINPDAQFATGVVVSARTDSGSVSGYLLHLKGQGEGFTQPRWLGLTTSDGIAWQPLISQSGAIADDLFHWKHLVLRVSFTDDGVGARTLSMFIDGAELQSNDLVGDQIAYASGAQPRIGEETLPLVGTVGLVRMWSESLTDDQVMWAFAQNAERFMSSSKPAPAVDLPPPLLHYEATRCPTSG